MISSANLLDWHHPVHYGDLQSLPQRCVHYYDIHYNDVIMSVMASQIPSLTIVYSAVYSGVDQRKHQRSASLAFVRGIHRSPVNSPHKGPVTRKMFPFDDVIICCSFSNVFNFMICIYACDVWHWWGCTQSQFVGLVLGCALFWCWMSLTVILFSLLILLLVAYFIIIITTIIGVFTSMAIPTTDLAFLKLSIVLAHSPPRMFLPLDLLLEYCIKHVVIGFKDILQISFMLCNWLSLQCWRRGLTTCSCLLAFLKI